MVVDFFYLLRVRGFKSSVHEYFNLLEAIEAGLHENSVLGFYRLSRMLLCHDEADYDAFDLIFYEYFKDIESLPELQLDEKFYEWLNSSGADREFLENSTINSLEEYQDILRRFKQRALDQEERHDGGCYYIGTGGVSDYGNSGKKTSGIRAGGESMYQSAVEVAGERRYKDFRKDKGLDTRSFTLAFRRLRNLSAGDKTENIIDIDETIDATGDHAGMLSIRYKRPRKNAIKILVLIDSGGTMERYAKLSKQLFDALNSANHYKDLKFYYFHNAVYQKLYTSPACRYGDWADTRQLMKSLDGEYKLIIVGDAYMHSYQLMTAEGSYSCGVDGAEAGIVWFERLNKHFRKSIWLNPIPDKDRPYRDASGTISRLSSVYSMYDLSEEGLSIGIKNLLRR